MDNRQLQIVLKLQDDASKELRKLSGELNVAEKSTTRWGGALEYVAGAAKYATVALGAAAIAGATWGVKVAAQLETAEVGLKTLLGSAEKAASTVERLKVEAARTPFELPGLTQAVQLLSSVTKDGNKSIDIILDIGEGLAAMGKGQAELDRIIVNLQQIAAVGKAATIDIKQFAFAGIPIYEMLTETTGKSGEALAELIENGGVTFELLTKMFDQANDAGGRFFNAYKNQSGTFNQATSNMKDSLGIFMADMVKTTGLFKLLTESMIFASSWLGNYKQNVAEAISTVQEWLQVLDENTGLVTMLTETWRTLVFVFMDQLKPALTELWDSMKGLQPFLEAAALAFGVTLVVAVGLLVTVVGGLVIAVIALLTWFVKIESFLMDVWMKAWNATIDIISDVIVVVDNLIEKFKTAWEWAGKVTSKAGSFISGATNAVINAVIPGRATGGPVEAGMPYMVGEKGPELFVPRSSGSIVPNGAGGGNVVVNVYGDVSGRELIDKVQEAIMAGLRSNTKLAI